MMPSRRKKKGTSSCQRALLFLLCQVFIGEFYFLMNSEVNLAEVAPLRNDRGIILPSSPSVAHGSHMDETILFVHVGKTAGETIQWRMKISCTLRKSKRLKAGCQELFNDDESFLSKATIGHLHCNRLRPRHSIHNASIFLFSLRNPIDRIVSWFQYMHPDNCFADRPSAACNLKKDGNPWGIRFYQDCFPDINDFVRAMKDTEASTNVTSPKGCSLMAVETVQGRGPEGPSNHMFYNYQYYVNRTISQFRERKILVVRQEAIWDDLRRVEQYLGGSPTYKFEDHGPSITHGSERYRYRGHLDNSLTIRLCCSIPDEIAAYSTIVTLAANLDETLKLQTLQNLLQSCHISSLSELARKCQWESAEWMGTRLLKNIKIIP